MNIGIHKGMKKTLIIILLIFAGWWWLQSWTAYRTVRPSTEIRREALAKLADSAPENISEARLLHLAWLRGALDMNAYMTFRHESVILLCLLIITILGFMPEIRKEEVPTKASNNTR